MNEHGMWMYNKQGAEYWNGDAFETESQAIKEAFDDKDFVKENCMKDNESNYLLQIAIGQVNQPTISKTVDLADHVIEYIQSHHADEYGEYADNYLDHVTKEQMESLKSALTQVVEKWANNNNLQPNHYLIEGTSENDFLIESGNALIWAKEVLG